VKGPTSPSVIAAPHGADPPPAGAARGTVQIDSIPRAQW